MQTLTNTKLTTKGERTREHILDHALRLFIGQGYDETTMRDIATAADCSLGLTYRYFARKEDLVLALYRRLAEEQEAYVLALPPAPLADRFVQVLQAKLAQLDPYRSAIGALFGAALTPQSGVAVLGDETSNIRARMERMFLAMITGATDAPRERQARQLAIVLYALELALVLVWLHDRLPYLLAITELPQISHDCIASLRDVVGEADV